MLSPVESLGLRGAALDHRVRQALHHIADGTLARVAARLRRDALANDVVYEREGSIEAIPIMLRPLLAMPDQVNYVDHVCLKLAEALKRLPSLYLENAEVRRVLAITPGEEQWLRDVWTPRHQQLNPIYGRLDAVCDFTCAGWQDSLQFMEPNLSGVGGIHYAPVAEQLVVRDVVPTIVAHDPELTIELPRDQRDLFIQVLIDHARLIGRDACRLCFVEPKYVREGPTEQPILSRYFSERHGLIIMHADPRELRVDGDEVLFGDVAVDVVYRDYETRDLVALEREMGQPLEAMRLLFRQNRIVSSLVGDFDHKSCWELLTDDSLAPRFFSAEECRLFRRHVLWTRVVADRSTLLPHGSVGNLLDYARQHREQLVLKPNRGYGGKGVTLGAATEANVWERLLGEAAGQADDTESSWVVQAATRLPVHEFPVVGEDGRVFDEPFYVVMGFAPTENGLGILCRVSQKQVVNVAQHGGLAAVLVANPPRELRVPKRAMARKESAEQSLRARIIELLHLDQVIGLMGWDEETMLPGAGRAQRGEQLATLEGLRRALLTSDQLGDLVEEVAEHRGGDARWSRELALLRRLRRLALAVPDELVREFARAKSRCLGAWEAARDRNDFSVFASPFEQVMGLVRERAQALARGADSYDALLEEYEPSMTRSRLEPIMTELRDRIVPIVRQSAATAAPAGDRLHGRQFAEAGQWELCRRVLRAIGFDFERGRLDPSTHPFALLAGAHDVRLTLRIRKEDLARTLLTTLHEGGHGLYDQGFMATDRDSLLGEAPSMGLHESQARLWENHVGRARAFWQYWFPAINGLFPDTAAQLDEEAFYDAVNSIRPGINRVAADEVSCHLHIYIRYELELALMCGDLSVRDLPAVWNRRYAELLGTTPTADREGALQDVHWALGMFGYFPSYTVGSLYAAQLAEAYGQEHSLEEEIRRGEFNGLAAWLRSHVYQVGHRFSGEEIIRRATGDRLSIAPFLRHVACVHAELAR
jgi:carboxypeptidase Taq